MIKIKKNCKVHKLPKLTNMFEERGHRIGRAKGEEIGRKIGKDIGEKQEKERIALKMLKKEMNIELIEEITGLVKEDIQKLKS